MLEKKRAANSNTNGKRRKKAMRKTTVEVSDVFLKVILLSLWGKKVVFISLRKVVNNSTVFQIIGCRSWSDY